MRKLSSRTERMPQSEILGKPAETACRQKNMVLFGSEEMARRRSYNFKTATFTTLSLWRPYRRTGPSHWRR
jgi:hypothetical protein